MADDGCNNSAGNDIVELEAMRKDSFSWHPCQISLCSRGSGLIVLYENNNLEERITDKEEVSARIRIRSTPLQGDDCSSIRQGELVIATKSSRVKGAFYDARVEEAIHVRHSKRIYCRCTFRIKWLHQAFDEEASTVPSSSIMKLAKKSIHLHPTISTFFSMLESANSLHTTPCPVIVDELHSEMDINVLLEKQIKEISNSTDISQEIISPGFVFRQEDGFKKHCHARIIDASLKGPHVTFPLPNTTLKGLNGSENRQPTVEIPRVCISSIEGEFTGSRFLSPLAARAALASLRSEFPQSPHFSAQSDVQKGDRTSNIEGVSLNISAAFEGESPEFKNTVRTLFPTSTSPKKNGFSSLSSLAQKNEMDKNKKTGEKKISQPSKSRFTRSQAQKGNGSEVATQMTNIIETQSRLTKTGRVTRSTVDAKEYNPASTYDVHTVPAQNCLPQKPERLVNGETTECSDTDDIEQDYPKRLTRSAAQEETEKKRKLRNRSSDTLLKSTPKAKASDSGNNVGSYQGRSGRSKKQDTRSSNQSRFLPRTRSQSKA